MPVATGSEQFVCPTTGVFLTNLPVTYLFRTTGQVLGVSLSGAILQGVLLQKLRERIRVPNSAEVGFLSIKSHLHLNSLPAERSFMKFGKSCTSILGIRRAYLWFPVTQPPVYEISIPNGEKRLSTRTRMRYTSCLSSRASWHSSHSLRVFRLKKILCREPRHPPLHFKRSLKRPETAEHHRSRRSTSGIRKWIEMGRTRTRTMGCSLKQYSNWMYLYGTI